MRVLWVDSDKSPWTDTNGWKVVEEFGLKIRQLDNSVLLSQAIQQRDYELLILRVEDSAFEANLKIAKSFLKNDPRKIIVCSSDWKKEDFKQHAKTALGADRYAKVPMPPEGFLGLVADLFGLSIDEIGEFEFPKEMHSKSEVVEPKAPLPKKTVKPKIPFSQSEDIETLRKYLKIKEEQLAIADSEREELSIERERLTKEIQILSSRLREAEHGRSEIQRRYNNLEEEKEEISKIAALEREDLERLNKQQTDRIRALEKESRQVKDRYEELRIRVRKDIRKIRSNERDLEARLELLRKDSETLLQARDLKVLEMQRKIDALEFDLDQVQDSRVQAQIESDRYLSKLSKVARALNLAIGLVEEEQKEEDLFEDDPILGGAALAEEEIHEAPSLAEKVAESVDAQADAPNEADAPAESLENLEEVGADLDALANDGDPTKMVNLESIGDFNDEPESSSG
ncbi:MAG: hypothetical protein M9962_06910 [Oligoflexia bacterium]|nr:hypothetical protein [Oligoflexia bacterium]